MFRCSICDLNSVRFKGIPHKKLLPSILHVIIYRSCYYLMFYQATLKSFSNLPIFALVAVSFLPTSSTSKNV